jgi:hypothetical protein
VLLAGVRGRMRSPRRQERQGRKRWGAGAGRATDGGSLISPLYPLRALPPPTLASWRLGVHMVRLRAPARHRTRGSGRAWRAGRSHRRGIVAPGGGGSAGRAWRRERPGGRRPVRRRTSRGRRPFRVARRTEPREDLAHGIGHVEVPQAVGRLRGVGEPAGGWAVEIRHGDESPVDDEPPARGDELRRVRGGGAPPEVVLGPVAAGPEQARRYQQEQGEYSQQVEQPARQRRDCTALRHRAGTSRGGEPRLAEWAELLAAGRPEVTCRPRARGA